MGGERSFGIIWNYQSIKMLSYAIWKYYFSIIFKNNWEENENKTNLTNRKEGRSKNAPSYLISNHVTIFVECLLCAEDWRRQYGTD